MLIKRYFSLLKQYDWWLFGLVFLLVIFGLVIIYSIGANGENPDLTKFYKQAIFALIGLGLLGFFSFIDFRQLSSYAYILYIFSFIILVLLLIFGATVRGTTGWFKIGPLSVQPVELVKLFYVIFLARFFSDKSVNMDNFKNIFLSGLFTAILVD